jgi:cell division protein ZapA
VADKAPLVHVEIFGLSYALRAGDDPGYLERLAAFVDQRMKEVASGAGSVDSVRVAVLAALNIADELHRSREGASGTKALEARAESLAKELAAALGD